MNRQSRTPTTRWKNRGWEVPTLITAGIVLLCVLAAVVVHKGREWSHKRKCRAKLETIALAIQNYRDNYGCLPPVMITDADGKPMHSWRVQILPYLETNWFRDLYHLDEPWNGPHNLRLTDVYEIYDKVHGLRKDVTNIRRNFRCPAATSGDDRYTNYVMVVDPSDPLVPLPKGTFNSRWGPHPKARFGADGEIMVVEIADSDIHWMEPRDLSLDQMSFSVNDKSAPSISSCHVGGAFVIMRDGAVVFLDASTTKQRLRDMVVGGRTRSRDR